MIKKRLFLPYILLFLTCIPCIVATIQPYQQKQIVLGITTIVADGSAGCGKSWQAGKDMTETLSFGGRNRSYIIHVPSGYNPSSPTMLVLNLSGATMQAVHEELVTDMSPLADQKGFIVVYPDATTGANGKDIGWNVYFDTDPPFLNTNWRKIDDVGFLNTLVSKLQQEMCVDKNHMAITGFSLGASMAYHMACVGTPWLSAIGLVSTIMPQAVSSCHFSHPVSLLSINGEADPVVSYTGWGLIWTVPDSVANYAQVMGCQKSGHTGFQQDDVIQTLYAPCNTSADVQLYSVTDGGHTWPGGFPIFWLGKSTNIINASQLIADFFNNHPLVSSFTTPSPSPVVSITGNPNPSVTLSVTPVQNVTKVFFPSIKLHGIGSGGDSVSPNSSGNQNPVDKTNILEVELYNDKNQLAAKVSGIITYQAQTGDFQGSVLPGNIPDGNYIIKVRIGKYLRLQIPGIQTIAIKQITTMPAISLITGDINGDNTLNILDYNILLGCFSDIKSAPSCNVTKKQEADLNDDGLVNQNDYNLFLRELSVEMGG